MSYAHHFRARCRNCNRRREEGELYSRTGLCSSCSVRIARENHRQLKAHGGPRFDHWRRRTLAAFGVFLEEEREPELELEQADS